MLKVSLIECTPNDRTRCMHQDVDPVSLATPLQMFFLYTNRAGKSNRFLLHWQYTRLGGIYIARAVL